MALTHLVGSVNLDDAEEVFRTVSEVLGDQILRMSDGETNAKNWIGVQMPRLGSNPALHPAPPIPNTYRPIPAWQLRDGVKASDVELDLGYAAAAVASYATLTRLKQGGIVPAGVRFQVSLPSPIAITAALIAARDQRALAPVVERALIEEAKRIAVTVPAEELAIQWDVAVEFAVLEGAMDFALSRSEMFDLLVRLGDAVPAEIEVGYHLCYGDAEREPGAGGEHFMQPRDTALMVAVANAIGRVRRTIEFLHLPVPIDRDDDAYYEPLRQLELHPETTLFLGLVHYQDGVAGTQRRIETAAKFVRGFGVATECGMGRRPSDRIRELLEIHRDVVVPGSRAQAASAT